MITNGPPRASGTDGRRGLSEEIRQTRPFQSPAQEALLALLRTTDLLRHHLTRVLAPWGITLQQYNVLRILRGADEEGLPTLGIAERMIERAPGITRLLDRLEARDWIVRTRCPEDRRQVLCRLTPAGQELLQELDPTMNTADEVLSDRLQPEEIEQLIDFLERIRTEPPQEDAP